MKPCKSITDSIILQKGNFAIQPGTLYITGTPIGNLGDITIRALEVLSTVDFIICEDTRKTSILLQHYGIKAKLMVYNDHSTARERNGFINMLQNGQNAALVSDAGMPLIADPGYKLVVDITASDLRVEVIPGPSATLSAIALSGLPSERFVFYGFMPEREVAKRKAIAEFKCTPYTIVFFESPKRLISSLLLMDEVMPLRKIAITREITKLYEEVYRGDVVEALSWAKSHACLKGEIAVVVAPETKSEQEPIQLEVLAMEMLKSHSIKDTANELAKNFSVPKKQIYELCLKIKAS